MNKKTDAIWRIIGIIIFLLLIFGLIITNKIIFWISVGFLILYDIISMIMFLPRILKKLRKKLKRKS